MNGKGIMIWKGVNYGTLDECVQACVSMGLKWVALKIGDATDTIYASFPGNMLTAVNAFKAAGMQVWGWQYIYGGIWIDKAGVVHVEGASPAQEAAYAKLHVRTLGLDGYLIDAEKEYKVHNQDFRAASFMSGLAGIGVPVGLCSYRFPTLHATFPWNTFLQGCQYHAPQVYHGPGRGIIDLERSYTELMAKKPLPIVPVGRAYIGDGYGEPGPSGAELTQFMIHAQNKGCPGISWWAMDFLRLHMGGAERQAAISAYQWSPSDTDKPPVPIGKIQVTASVLNLRAGPDALSADRGDLARGTILYAFRESGAWAEVGDGVWAKTGTDLSSWIKRWQGVP